MFFAKLKGGKTLLHYRLCRAVLLAFLFFITTSNTNVSAQRNDAYAYQVFETLVRTINRNIPTKPVLIIENSSRLIAETYGNGQVKVGYTLLEKCRSFGADSSAALAHILSHELMHYYNNHFWSDAFGTAYADAEWGKQLAKVGADTITVQLHESQADLYAMYYSFNAGYETYRIAGDVLDSIYKWYRLPEKIDGYPARKERIKMANDAATEIAALLPLFESSNMLLHIANAYAGEEMLSIVKLASLGFGVILDNNIQTKEMLNNAAIARIMESLIYLDNDTLLALQWPFVTESESMLYNMSGTRGGGNDVKSDELIKQLLSESVTLLDNAIQIDKTFYPAYINKCIALLLLKKYGSCSDELDAVAEYLPADKKYLAPEITGLMYLLKGKKELAKDELNLASEQGSKSALANYNAYTDPTQIFSPALIVGIDTANKINGLYIGEYLEQFKTSRQNRIELSLGAGTVFYDTIPEGMVTDVRPVPGSSPFRNVKLVLFRTSDSKTGKNIAIGSSVNQLEKAHGTPYRILNESLQTVYLYPGQNLLVWLQNGTVTKWCYWWAK